QAEPHPTLLTDPVCDLAPGPDRTPGVELPLTGLDGSMILWLHDPRSQIPEEDPPERGVDVEQVKLGHGHYEGHQCPEGVPRGEGGDEGLTQRSEHRQAAQSQDEG